MLRPLLPRLLSLPGGATTPPARKIILLGYIAVCVNDARTLRSRVVREVCGLLRVTSSLAPRSGERNESASGLVSFDPPPPPRLPTNLIKPLITSNLSRYQLPPLPNSTKIPEILFSLINPYLLLVHFSKESRKFPSRPKNEKLVQIEGGSPLLSRRMSLGRWRVCWVPGSISRLCINQQWAEPTWRDTVEVGRKPLSRHAASFDLSRGKGKEISPPFLPPSPR